MWHHVILTASAEKAFADPEGVYDIVVNLAAETKYGQSDEVVHYHGNQICYYSYQVYKERVLTIALNCAHLAAKMSAKKFIEVSTAQVYDSGKVSGCGHDMISCHITDPQQGGF